MALSTQTVQWLIIGASFVLQMLLLTALLRGAYKRYPIAFAYSIILFLTTVMDVAAISNFGGKFAIEFAGQYYKTEALRQILLFAVVVSLIDRAVERTDVRAQVRWLLIGVAILAVSWSLYSHRTDGSTAMLGTKVVRDISFVSVLLTLGLWLVLISQRTRDRMLLMVTGGLGLQFTGEAIGQSIRQLSGSVGRNEYVLLVGNLILVGSHLLRLYVWWETFRRVPARSLPEDDRVTEPTPIPAATLRS